ncbi:DNA-directed RNA polymerase subunit beta [Nocardia grenadensis]|uniref:DNA-directed RNA polymerase subunit beta n=1 Tax=Nocardia grenadensis TaxID=931537 RepID=UPI003D945F3B
MDHVFLGDTPLTRCRYYRQVCDLPARIDPPELGRIVMPAGHTWALMMPSALGFAVKKDLQRCRDHDAGTGAGPIISHIRSGRWSFLIRPDLPDDTALFAEMFRLNVSVVRTGATIALPSPTDRGALFRRWIQPPRSPFCPSGRLVIDSVRACAARGGWLRTPTGQTQ